MPANPTQRTGQPDRTPKRDDAATPDKRTERPGDAPTKPSERKRKQECDALGERFPEQCDTPVAEDAPPQVMPDEKKADSRPQRRESQ